MTYPIYLPNLNIHSVEEDWTTDSVFTGTFSEPEKTDLCSVTIEIEDPETTEKFLIHISPNQIGSYGYYDKTGKGLSTEILVTVINLLTTPEVKITAQKFIEEILENYSRDFTIKINGIIQNRLIYVNESTEISKEYKDIRNILDLFEFETSYNSHGNILGELNKEIPYTYNSRFFDLNNYLISQLTNKSSIVIVVPKTNLFHISDSIKGNSLVHIANKNKL